MSSSTAPIEQESAPRRLTALALWLTLTGLLTIAAFWASPAGDAEDDAPIYEWSTAASSLIFYAVILGLTFAIASLYPRASDALGLRRFESRWIWAAAGVVVVSLIVAAALEPLLHAGEEQGLAPQEWRPDELAPFLVNAVLISTWGPFAEELLYRGLGVTVLGVLGPALAMVGTAVAFALVHGLLVALPPLVVFGLGLAWVRVKADSVWPCFIAHGAYNALGVAISAAVAS